MARHAILRNDYENTFCEKVRRGSRYVFVFFSFLSFSLTVFCLLIYCTTLGKLSPTTRLETSFDAEGATKSDDRHVVPEDPAVKEESDALATATHDKVKLTVVQFERENPGLKWFLRIMSVMLLVCLLFLWIYYR